MNLLKYKLFVEQTVQDEILYHATNYTWKTPEMRGFGFHAGTLKSAQDRAKSFSPKINTRIIKLKLHIQNPLIINRDYRFHDNLTKVSSELYKDNIITKEERDKFIRIYDNEATFENLRKLLYEKYGYDGIKYRNNIEDRGSYSYIAFFPEQIEILDYNILENNLSENSQYDNLLYHGTIVDYEENIREIGLIPMIGQFVKDMYGGEYSAAGMNIEEMEELNLIFFADKRSLLKCLTAMIHLISKRLNKSFNKVTIEDIRKHGLLLTIEYDNRIIKHKSDDKEDMYDEHPITVQPGDYYSNEEICDIVEYIKGDDLINFIEEHNLLGWLKINENVKYSEISIKPNFSRSSGLSSEVVYLSRSKKYANAYANGRTSDAHIGSGNIENGVLFYVYLTDEDSHYGGDVWISGFKDDIITDLKEHIKEYDVDEMYSNHNMDRTTKNFLIDCNIDDNNIESVEYLITLLENDNLSLMSPLNWSYLQESEQGYSEICLKDVPFSKIVGIKIYQDGELIKKIKGGCKNPDKDNGSIFYHGSPLKYWTKLID